MDKITLAYLAGVMDSDGYFTIKRSTYHMRVTKDAGNPIFFERCGIKQVSPEAIHLIRDNFGGYYRIEKPSCKNGKPLFAIELSNKKGNLFIKAIFPYLRIKKAQAQILLNLRKLLDKPRAGHRLVNHLDRWGRMRTFRQSIVSPKQVQRREQMVAQVKALNDTRPWSYIPPKHVLQPNSE